MNRTLFLLMAALAIVALSASGFAQDQASANGTIIAPPSTRGLAPGHARTPLYIFVPNGGLTPNSPPASAETPSSLACIYGVSPPTNGCPRNGTIVASGGTKAIAVVEYGNNTPLQSDFNTFNTQYGLPTQTLQVICAASCGTCPNNSGTGWDVETALDVEYAHAMAPHAQIIVAEFCSDPVGDGTETDAANAVAAAGGGEVSNSWTYEFNNNPNGGEDPSELQLDQFFMVSGVVYFGSAGDSGLGPAYPSVSPNVVSAGGTRVVRDSNGNFTGEEDCWNGSGGGISLYEPLPQYQLIIGNLTGPKRGTPDLSADASPNSGVAVYTTTGCGGWCQVGGTSVASPVLAGIVNAAGSFFSLTEKQLSKEYMLYRNPGLYHQYIYDVTKGSNGSAAKLGWDQCTGLGSPRKLNGF